MENLTNSFVRTKNIGYETKDFDIYDENNLSITSKEESLYSSYDEDEEKDIFLTKDSMK